MALTLAVYTSRNEVVRGFGPPAGLTFSTKLPGGCFQLSVELTSDFADRFYEQELPHITRCELSHPGGGVIWTGRRYQPTLQRQKTVMTFLGWGQSLHDNTFAFAADRYTTPVYPHQIIADLVTQIGVHLDGSTRDIQHNFTDLSGGTTNSISQLNYHLGDQVLNDLLKYPDTSGRLFYWAVWPKQVWPDGWVERFSYFPKAVAPTWLVDERDLDENWSFTRDESEVYSSVTIQYTTLSGDTAYFSAQDRATWKALGYDKQAPLITLPSESRRTPETVAPIAIGYLAQHRTAIQRTSGFTLKLPLVQRMGGGFEPIYLMRAGDVVQVRGFPAANQEWQGTVDSLRSFLVLQTEYNANDGTMQLTPDYSAPTLDQVLARLLVQNPAA